MGVCENVCCVAAVVKNSVFYSLGVLKYVVCLCRGCDGCCVFCLYCEAWSCRCSCMTMTMTMTMTMMTMTMTMMTMTNNLFHKTYKCNRIE